MRTGASPFAPTAGLQQNRATQPTHAAAEDSKKIQPTTTTASSSTSAETTFEAFAPGVRSVGAAASVVSTASTAAAAARRNARRAQAISAEEARSNSRKALQAGAGVGPGHWQQQPGPRASPCSARSRAGGGRVGTRSALRTTCSAWPEPARWRGPRFLPPRGVLALFDIAAGALFQATSPQPMSQPASEDCVE